MNKLAYTAALGFFVAQSSSASSIEIDQSQTLSNASMGVGYFSPVGQSFVPTHDQIKRVSLKLKDITTSTTGSSAYVVLRESSIEGTVIGTSNSVVLEDCFNFEQGPGCGVAGGYGKEIEFDFDSNISVTPGQNYVIEIIVQGDEVGVDYAYNDEYNNGGLFKHGTAQSNDLWFTTQGPAVTIESILVSDGNNLVTYDLDGVQISSVAIPKNGNSESSRDLFRMSDGSVAVFNGTFQPDLSVLNSEQWSHYSMAGWSTPNNISYGGITAFENFVYVTDGSTSGASEKGIVRFDSSDSFSASRFLDNNAYIDVTLGLDNKLYALRNTYGDLDVVDPISMEVLTTLDLGHTSSSRAVIADATGNVYMASWNGTVTQFTPNGTSVNSVSIGGSLYDIDINSQGEFLVSDRDGNVTRMDQNLNVINSFSASSSGVFVAFGSFAPSEPNPLPEYCESKGNNTYYEWIDAVNINGQLVQTGNNQGYQFDDNVVWNLSRSQANSIQLNPGFGSGPYTEKWKIWIDLDGDHVFSESENVYAGSGSGALTANIDLSAAVSSETRMRVSMAYGSYPGSCGSFTYGEVEDFIVNIND